MVYRNVFLGIPLPKLEQERFRLLESQLERFKVLHLADKEEPHLTITFIDKLDDSRINEIREIVKGVTKGSGHLTIYVSGLDCFVHDRPKILYLKANLPDNLLKIKRDVEIQL